MGLEEEQSLLLNTCKITLELISDAQQGEYEGLVLLEAWRILK